MKKAVLIILALVFAVGISADIHAGGKKTETVVFVTSIHCGNCKKRVEENIPFEKGVKDIAVDLTTKKVAIEFDPAKTDLETLRKAIERLGYTASHEASEKPEKPESTE